MALRPSEDLNPQVVTGKPESRRTQLWNLTLGIARDALHVVARVPPI